MKIFNTIILIIIISIFYMGCDSSGGGDDTPDYKVEFTINGTTYTFTDAHDDPDDVSEGCIKSGTKTFIVSDNEETPDRYTYFTIPGTSSGTFNDTAGPLAFELVIPAGNNFLDDDTTADDFTFNITEFGEVDGVIKGTFSGTVKEIGTANTYPLTDGVFEVKRKADDSISVE